MKILVIGGMHGNEPLGIELVRMLRDKPLANIDVVMANPKAVAANKRFAEQDLNRVFPGMPAGTYEQRRAQSLLARAKKYDLVLDFHNTLADQPSCGFVGLEYDKRLVAVAGDLGIRRVIEAGYDCINKYAPNCLSVEICMRESDANAWYERLKNITTRQSKSPRLYRYLRRVTWDEIRQLTVSTWRPFTEIPDDDKQKLAIDGSACPIFIGSTLTEYYATLLKRINSSSDTI